jgi:hypothetical protein
MLRASQELWKKQAQVREAFMNEMLPKDPKKAFKEGKEITVFGAPKMAPDFTYKLKILISFLQITTSISSGLEVTWPAGFKRFLEIFSVVNLDLMALSSFDCVATTTFFDKYMMWGILPAALVVKVLLVYMVPQLIIARKDQDKKHARKEIRQKFWKIVVFMLFLIYPTVSRKVLQIFMCQKVYDTWYLRVDMRILCYEGEWNKYLPWALAFIALYPVGIVFLFWSKLFKYRYRLYEHGVEAQFGLLYAGYNRDVWWYEAADQFNKLSVTSLLWFAPRDWQLAVGMLVITIFTQSNLWLKPYLRKGDDRLQLLANTEIYLMFLVGFIFREAVELDDRTDFVLSVILITMTIGFFLAFMGGFFKVTWKKFLNRRKKQQLAKQGPQDEDDAPEDMVFLARNTAIMGDIPVLDNTVMVQGQKLGEPCSEKNMLAMLHTKLMTGLEEQAMISRYYTCLQLELNDMSIIGTRAADMGGYNDPFIKITLMEDGVEDRICKLRTKVIKKRKAKDRTSFPESMCMYLPINKKAYYSLRVSVHDWDLGGADDFLGMVKLFTRNIQIDDNATHEYPLGKDEMRNKEKSRTDFGGHFSAVIDFDPILEVPEEKTLNKHTDYVDMDVAIRAKEFVPEPWFPCNDPGAHEAEERAQDERDEEDYIDNVLASDDPNNVLSSVSGMDESMIESASNKQIGMELNIMPASDDAEEADADGRLTETDGQLTETDANEIPEETNE